MKVERSSKFIKYLSKYKSFELFETNLGERNLISFEEVVERIIKQIFECQFKTQLDLLIEKKQIESTCQTKLHP